MSSGRIDEAKGRTKKAIGEATDNKSLKDRGRIDRASAKTKKAVSSGAKQMKKAHRKVTP